ncbi:MAG: hypothetical protein BRC29_04450 [Nanohaloarchaea archaeon SW_7_43_1]|nr:MAG: hypothetical protein BRC29_04450 [Nanohaloarchaea archaeon SW_7_43_1]
MSLEEKYRKDVERIGESMEKVISRHKASKLKNFLDQILPIALLSLTFVLIFTLAVPVTDKMAVYINYLNWAVVLYFATRLSVELRLSDHREQFVHNHWLDFLLVVPAFSVLKQVKLVEMITEIGLFEEESAFISATFFKEAGIAARATKITRMVKRSIGL